MGWPNLFAVASLAAVVAGACGSNKTSQMPDATIDASHDASQSKCGNPGDVGNELGIGKFCATLTDCDSTPMAPLCSSLGDPKTHFCTKTCQATGSADQCGTGAMCTCGSSNECGCTPTACL